MRRILLLTFFIVATALVANAQHPTSFTYQGKLNVGSLPATGVYDFFFTVSDVATGTGAVDSTLFVSGMHVTNGAFTVNLDFPASVWTTNPGPRFLSVKAKPADSTYFELTPRQPISSAPFGIRALNADNSLVLGSIIGVNNTTSDANVGIGTTAPLSRLDVRGDIFVGLTALPSVPPEYFGTTRALFLANDDGDPNNSLRIDGAIDNLYLLARSGSGATNGAGIIFSTAPAGQGEFARMSIRPTGELRLHTLGANGATPLCINASDEISNCTAPFSDQQRRIDEQTTIIDSQKSRIEQLETQVDALKAVVCGLNPSAAVCVNNTAKP